ncbi:MAG: hypothetical protein OWU33_12545 [Firmicutes bacterium]|nr:hypothetical protein [Bacillota bacterium]
MTRMAMTLRRRLSTLRSSPRAQRRYAAGAAVVALGLLGWSGGTWAASPPAGAPWPQMVAQPGTATISVPYPTVGQSEALTAQGLPKRTAVRLVWQTVQGQWQVDGPTFIGAAYRYGTTVLARAVTTAQGMMHVRFAVPQGFGGTHLLGLELGSGKMAAETSVTVIPSVTLTSSRVPEGGFFQFTMTGIGYQPYFALFPVTYDNHLTGNVTAVTTDGTAHFAVRAVGVGFHEIEINNGVMGGPYLNEQQSPFPFMPTFAFPVTVLPGTPKNVSNPLPQLHNPASGKLTATPASGVVGGTLTLVGQHLAPHHRYTLTWWTMKASHVSGHGYAPVAVPWGSVTTNAAGAFRVHETVPSDLGGPPHRITLSDGSAVVATTFFRIFPKVVAITPNPAPEGSLVTVTLLGGGWTDYDNSFIGFGCAFSSQGNLQIQLRATGKPGLHFIDLYPSIWKGQDTLPNYYLVPQLTYNADHPGDWLPAFHLVLRVTAPRPAHSATRRA